MLYRKFGRTNEKVSALGFGCMRLPVIDNDQMKIDEKKAISMIRYAIDNGVNYIDTAYPYHGKGFNKGGESEPFLAKALKEGYRERVYLATKLPSWLIHSREDMDRFLNEQLERLQTEKIDFYLLHTLNKKDWANLKELGVYDFFNKATSDGRIKHVGFSFHDDLATFKKIVDDYDWSFCQIQYNYIDEDFQAGKEGLEYAAQKGLGIAIMEPLRGGNLVKNPPEEVGHIWNQAKVKRTPVEWALSWLWNHPQISVVLSGMTTMEHVIENINIANKAKENSLTQDELDMVDRVKEIYKEKLKVNCTNCKYCMPCPVGVNIPQNFALLNNYYLFNDAATKRMSKTAYNRVMPIKERASNCIECGKCESHCPQNISIRQELKKVRETFENQ